MDSSNQYRGTTCEDSDSDSSTASHHSLEQPPPLENSVPPDEDSDSGSSTASHHSLEQPPSLENSVPPDEDSDSGSSTASHHSLDHPPTMKTCVPPDEALVKNINSYIALFNTNVSELQALIDKLTEITDRLETTHRSATIRSISGGVTGAAGGITSTVGVILAPFTLGASLVMTEIGVKVAVAGGVTGATSNITDMVQQKTSREEIEDILKTFLNKMTPIIKCLKYTENNLQELQISELVRVVKTVRLGEPMAQLSKTMRAAVAMRALSGLFLALDFVFIDNNVQELNEIDKRKKDGREKSKTVKFIQDMRKTEVELQNVLDEMREIKNQFETKIIKILKLQSSAIYRLL